MATSPAPIETDDGEVKARAYRMYKDGELSEEQAKQLFGEEFETVEMMVRNDEIVAESPDPSADDDHLFF